MNTQAQRDNRNSGNSRGSCCNTRCRILYRIRYRNNSEVETAAVLAGNSSGKASAAELPVPAPRIAVLVADAQELEFLRAVLALWAWA